MDAVNWSSPVDWNHPLNRGLYGWWLTTPITRGGGRWIDLTGNNTSDIRDNTTVTSTLWRTSEGRRGGWGCLAFDGSNDNVLMDATSTTIMTGFGNFTVTSWVRTASNELQHLCGSYDGGDDGFGIDLNAGTGGAAADGALRCFSRTGVTSDVIGYTADTGFDDGTWHHIAVSWQLGPDIIDFYVDGKQWATSYDEQAAGTSHATFDRAILIGALNNEGTASNAVNGFLDDFRFYLRALSGAEIARLYELSMAGYPGLLNRSSQLYAVPVAGTVPRVMHHRRMQGMS